MLFFFADAGWDRLHGSDQGCPRKSDSWGDMLQNCTSTSSNTQDHRHEREIEEGGGTSTSMGPRQLSVSSDSRLLEDEIKQEVKVILRPKKPPRPQSEVFLDQVDKRRSTKRYSAFGVSVHKWIYRRKQKIFKLQFFYII